MLGPTSAAERLDDAVAVAKKSRVFLFHGIVTPLSHSYQQVDWVKPAESVASLPSALHSDWMERSSFLSMSSGGTSVKRMMDGQSCV